MIQGGWGILYEEIKTNIKFAMKYWKMGKRKKKPKEKKKKLFTPMFLADQKTKKKS